MVRHEFVDNIFYVCVLSVFLCVINRGTFIAKQT